MYAKLDLGLINRESGEDRVKQYTSNSNHRQQRNH